MSEALLQALLAVRKACAQLKAEVGPAQQARLDVINTVLARQIFDARDRPALESTLAAQRAAAQGAPLAERARVELAFAEACEQAIGQELRRGAGLEAGGGEPQAEAFDERAFRDFLVAELGENPALEVAAVTVASRGFSKKTLFVTLRGARVLPAEIALRVDRPFNFLETTVRDEFAPLVALHRAGICLPRPWALESSGKVLEGPFIVFERRPGGLIGNNFQAPARNPAIAADVARCLAQLHRTSPAVLAALRGAGMSAVEQTRQDLDKSFAHWQVLGRSLPLMDEAFRWLYENIGRADGECGVVHGDFNFNNMLVDGERVAAIVDWEFVHWGNPAADLGWFHYGAEGICGWEEFQRLYAAAGGFPLTRRQLDYFVLLGQTRLAVMTLQTDSGFDSGRFDDVKYGLSGSIYTNKALIRVARLLQAIAS